MLHVESAVFYGIMSTLMVFGNKHLLTNLNFNNPIFIVMTEMMLNVIVIIVLNRTVFSKYIDLKINTKTVYEFMQKPVTYKYHYLVILFYCLHSVLSLKALNGLNIPIYIMFKRCTPLLNLFISIFVFKNFNIENAHSRKIILSIVLITFGVILGSIGDLDPDIDSYLYCSISVVCQAAYLSSIQKCGESDANSQKKSSSLQTLFECSFFSIPILAALFFLTGEHKNVQVSFSINFLIVIIGVVACGSLLCFSQFWCTMNNNAITTSVIGVLKSIIQTIGGMFIIDSIKDFSNLTLLGIAINLTSSIWYTYLKYVEKLNGKLISPS
jgi:solute carrier family 35 protein